MPRKIKPPQEYENWTQHRGKQQTNFVEDPTKRRKKRNTRRKTVFLKGRQLAEMSGGNIFISFDDGTGQRFVFCSSDELWTQYTTTGLKSEAGEKRCDGKGNIVNVGNIGRAVINETVSIPTPSKSTDFPLSYTTYKTTESTDIVDDLDISREADQLHDSAEAEVGMEGSTVIDLGLQLSSADNTAIEVSADNTEIELTADTGIEITFTTANGVTTVSTTANPAPALDGCPQVPVKPTVVLPVGHSTPNDQEKSEEKSEKGSGEEAIPFAPRVPLTPIDSNKPTTSHVTSPLTTVSDVIDEQIGTGKIKVKSFYKPVEKKVRRALAPMMSSPMQSKKKERHPLMSPKMSASRKRRSSALTTKFRKTLDEIKNGKKHNKTK